MTNKEGSMVYDNDSRSVYYHCYYFPFHFGRKKHSFRVSRLNLLFFSKWAKDNTSRLPYRIGGGDKIHLQYVLYQPANSLERLFLSL
jgi:hypothetical protein